MTIFLKKLKYYTRLIAEKFVVLACSIFLSKYKSDIVVIRLDAIGDYILFRNFLIEIRTSKKFANKKITLIGNIAWREIAEILDNEVVDRFIWLDRNKLWKDKKYRLMILFKLAKYKFDYLISPTYSREFRHLDLLVNAINANYKIGSQGNLSNMTILEKEIGDKFYTQLVPANSGILFEFDRNKEFFNYLLGGNLYTSISIDLAANNPSLGLKHKSYVVLFIGASSPFRRWSIDKFIELSIWINSIYECDVLLCGTNSDLASQNYHVPEYAWLKNMIGKTSLFSMIELLGSAKFVISNETSIPHMCVGLDVNVFVISNGNHFGRFTPYPKSITDKYHPIYNLELVSYLNNFELLVSKYSDGSDLDINKIKVNEVKNIIMKITNVDIV